jgi:hypothetical protein
VYKGVQNESTGFPGTGFPGRILISFSLPLPAAFLRHGLIPPAHTSLRDVMRKIWNPWNDWLLPESPKTWSCLTGVVVGTFELLNRRKALNGWNCWNQPQDHFELLNIKP